MENRTLFQNYKGKFFRAHALRRVSRKKKTLRTYTNSSSWMRTTRSMQINRSCWRNVESWKSLDRLWTVMSWRSVFKSTTIFTFESSPHRLQLLRPLPLRHLSRRPIRQQLLLQQRLVKKISTPSTTNGIISFAVRTTTRIVIRISKSTLGVVFGNSNVRMNVRNRKVV